MSQLYKAVFLDRDGVIIEDVGFPHRPDQVRLLPRVAKAISLLNNQGFKVIVTTNQSGVARGLFTEQDVLDVSEYIRLSLLAHGATIDRTYYCPHLKDGIIKQYCIECSCRKPKIGMIEQALRDFRIGLSDSFVIGDNGSDIEFGYRAGCRTILLTGKGTRPNLSEQQNKPDHVADDLYEAALWITNLHGNQVK